MATMMLNSQNWLGLSGRWSPRKVCVAWILTLVATLAQAQSAASQASAPTAPTAASGAAAVASGPGAPVPRKWLGVPRVYGRITAKGLGVVINTDDPYSVQVGEYYVKARGIRAENVLRVKLPIRSTLSVTEFTALSRQVDQFFDDGL
jgi:hypothetical protein